MLNSCFHLLLLLFYVLYFKNPSSFCQIYLILQGKHKGRENSGKYKKESLNQPDVFISAGKMYGIHRLDTPPFLHFPSEGLDKEKAVIVKITHFYF